MIIFRLFLPGNVGVGIQHVVEACPPHLLGTLMPGLQLDSPLQTPPT